MLVVIHNIEIDISQTSKLNLIQGDLMYVVDVVKKDIEERKVFLHMVKTAGTSIHRGIVLAKHKIQFNQRHAHISILPQKYQDLPRYIILRKPEDWYVSFYNFFLPIDGFFSFMLRDDTGTPVGINEFIFRALNMKHFFGTHKFKRDILNDMLNKQETSHFIFTFFTEQVTDQNTMDYNFSVFDWFWRGSGGDTATVFPMNENGIKSLEKEFNIKMDHENKTEIPNEFLDILPVEKSDICEEMLQLIRDVDFKYYDILEELEVLKY